MNPGRADPNLLEPAGPTDPQVSFLSVKSKDGRPIALLANYSLHYVGGVPEGHVSADYFAVFAESIGRRIGADRLVPSFVGIMTNGTSGDVNNINFRAPRPPLPPSPPPVTAAAPLPSRQAPPRRPVLRRLPAHRRD